MTPTEFATFLRERIDEFELVWNNAFRNDVEFDIPAPSNLPEWIEEFIDHLNDIKGEHKYDDDPPF